MIRRYFQRELIEEVTALKAALIDARDYSAILERDLLFCSDKLADAEIELTILRKQIHLNDLRMMNDLAARREAATRFHLEQYKLEHGLSQDPLPVEGAEDLDEVDGPITMTVDKKSASASS